jgi:hypothetical protein
MSRKQKEEICISSTENINFIYVTIFQDKFEIAVKSPWANYIAFEIRFLFLSKINFVRKINDLFVVCLCIGKVGIMPTVWTSTEIFPSSSTILRPTASRNSGITHLEADPLFSTPGAQVLST